MKEPGDEPLLAHLARSKHEDIAVEALGFILRSGEARKVIEQALKDEGADVRTIDRFRTQVGGQGRPDLVGFGGKNKDDECVLIEAKFWAGLTDKQPEDYLERLKRSGPSCAEGQEFAGRKPLPRRWTSRASGPTTGSS